MLERMKSMAATAVLACVASTASAMNLGPNPVIAGVPVSCMGAITVVQPIPDIAMAQPGVILLHPMLFQWPAPMQLFMYAHECAHQLYGGNEQVADCWAAQTGKQQGWFSYQDLVYVLQAFGASPGDQTHLPGPLRVQHILACYENG